MADPLAFYLFVTFIMEATHTERVIKTRVGSSYILRPGECVIDLLALAARMQLTRSAVRNAMGKLEAASMIERGEPIRHVGSRIRLTNWAQYQSSGSDHKMGDFATTSQSEERPQDEPQGSPSKVLAFQGKQAPGAVASDHKTDHKKEAGATTKRPRKQPLLQECTSEECSPPPTPPPALAALASDGTLDRVRSMVGWSRKKGSLTDGAWSKALEAMARFVEANGEPPLREAIRVYSDRRYFDLGRGEKYLLGIARGKVKELERERTAKAAAIEQSGRRPVRGGEHECFFCHLRFATSDHMLGHCWSDHPEESALHSVRKPEGDANANRCVG